MKNEKYQTPINIYISSSYDDAELAQKFLSDYVKGFGITVDKQRNGDNLYVTIDGLDEDIDALVSVYTAQYDEFKKDCKAEPSGWVSPVNLEKSKEEESMKSESNIEDLRDQTISCGTMRSEDLIPKFLGVLKTYAKDKYDEYVNENPEVLDIDGLDDETLGWIVDELFDELDKIAPAGTYFGAHPDDGADYGFWSVDQYESKKPEACKGGKDDDKKDGKDGKAAESKKSESSDAGATDDVIHILSTAYDMTEPYGFVNDGVGTIIADVDSDDKVSFECWLYPYVVSDIMRDNVGDDEIGNYFKDMCDAMESSLDGTSLKYFKSLDIDSIVRGNHCIHVDFSVPMDVVLDLIASSDDPVQTLKDARDEAVATINKVWKPYCDDILENGTKYITPKKARCEVGLNAEESKKSEAYEDIWRGANVMTHDEACEQIDLPADRMQDFIDEYGENWDEDPDTMNEYVQSVNDFVDSCFDQDYVSIDGEEIPLGVSRDPKLLIVLTDDTKHGDEAVELVKKLANGELTGSSDDGDYVAIMDGVNGSPHFNIYSEEPKSEGKDDKGGKDDKDCKGKGCDGSDEKCGGDKKNETDKGTSEHPVRAMYDWAEKLGVCPSFSLSDEFGPFDDDDYYAVDGFCFGDDDNDIDGPMVYGSNDISYYNDGSWGYALADGTIYGDHKDSTFIKSLLNTYKDKGLKATIEFAVESGDEIATKMPDFDKHESRQVEDAGNNWVAYYFCKDPQGLEWAVLPHTVSMLGNVNCVNARGGMESIGKEYVLSKCTPVEDVESSEIWKAVCDGEDRKVVAIDRNDAERVLRAENGLEELKSVVAGKDESKKSEKSTTQIETYAGFEELVGYADAEYLLEDVVDVLSKYYTYEGEGEDIFFGEDQAKDDPEFTIKIEGGDERADYYYENIFYVHLPNKDAAEELASVLGGKLEESKKKESLYGRPDSKKNETNSPEEEAVKKVLMDASADAEFRREAGKDFSAEDFEKSIDANIEKLRDVFLDVLYFDDGSFKCDVNDHEETRDLCSFVASKVGYVLGLPDGVMTAIDGYLLWDVVQENIVSDESKKSESLTLKQAELKKMAKYGEAEDITGLSDAEAKELKKSGVELVGISRGTYGMNGALMRGTADGKLYVITSRNSNLFYFV